ncbi:Transient receptor potential cation channel trpm [Nymphon striatum]|nr:Transient receptor potential cation channel trpm [Nymphon striatum]
MWPSSSPDISPIDFAIWFIVKSDIVAKSYSSVAALKEALLASWSTLHEEVVRISCHQSFGARLNTTYDRLLDNTPSNILNHTDYGVPVVCVVIEGGTHTIRCVLDSVTDIPPIPVVVCDGSGRAADLLAFTNKYTENGTMINSLQEQLLITIEHTFSCQRDQAEQLLLELQQCVAKKELMTVFRMGEGPCQELDQAILTALLKGHRLPITDQLSLALTWNRADIASSEIFVYGQDWPPGALDQAMMNALVHDRVDFVKILLKNGVTMNKFLNIPRLEELYNTREGPTNTLIYLVKDVKKNMPSDYRYTLYDIGLVIEKLMGGAFRSSYCRRKFRELYNTVMKRSPTQNNARRLKSAANLLAINDSDSTFMYPFHELLIWAVLMKRQKMALFMWQHGEEAVVKSLIACKLYKSMSTEAAQDDLETDIYEEMIKNAEEFEQLALELLDYCYRQDDDMTEQLLTYELQCWSKQTCLSTAKSAGHLSFLAHSASQLLLSDLWMGGLRMRRNTNLKVILGLLFPVTILKLEFKSKEELLHMPQTEEEHIMDRSDSDDSMNIIHLEPIVGVESNSSIHGQYNIIPSKNQNGSLLSPMDKWHTDGSDKVFMRQRPLNLGKKFSEFYGAPITKFWSHSIAYFIFLLCYTYVVLVKMNPKNPNWCEIYVFGYLFTLTMEKTRELMSSEAVTFYSKLIVWCEKKWNPCDVCAIVLFMVGACMRFSPGIHYEGRVVYCVNIIYWYLRILDILSVNKYLGPYVTMIGKMVMNMIYFVVLLLVIMLSYGVMRQSLLFPNEEPSLLLIRDLFFQPYFMLYGEVFADKIDPECGGKDQPPCHPGRWINPLVMSVYLLVANILLINLLIAVFNNIFQDLNAISLQVWKFQRFYVVMEYESKPVLPPPLILFSHLRILYRYCYRNWKGKPWVFDHGLKLFLSEEYVERNHDFEEECVEGYFREKEMKLQMSTAEQVKITTERIDQVCQRVEDINQRDKGSKLSFQSLEFRLAHLEDLAQQTFSSMSVIHRFMANHMTDISPPVGTAASNHFLSASSSMESHPADFFSDSSNKSLKPRPDADDLKDGVSPSKVSFATPVIEEEEIDEDEENDDSASSFHSTASPFADRKLLLRSNLLQRRLHRSKKHDPHYPDTVVSSDCVIELPGESSEKEVSHMEKSPSAIHNLGRMRRASSTQSEPENITSHSPPRHPKVERSVSSVTWRQYKDLTDTPSIIVMPATPRPHMLKGPTLTEYTSITDELENQACLVAHLAPPVLESPTLAAKRPNMSRHGSSEIEEAAQEMTEFLHSAEVSDYNLMQGIIQRRLHRDSENLTESMEDLCQIDSFGEDQSDDSHDDDDDDNDAVAVAQSSPNQSKSVFYLPESSC